VDVHKCYKLVTVGETSMTNSQSVDYSVSVMTKSFVMTSNAYSLIDSIKFVIYTIAPDLLPFFKTVPRKHEE